MFGYVTPLKSELKFKEFEYFRSYYCGLCNEIKREYGNIPRFCLNYDLTFIGFLLDGLYSTPLNLDSIKCLRHPNKKIIITKQTNALNYCANLSILLFDYKLTDNIKDDKSIKSKIFKFLLSSSSKKSLLKLENISNKISNNITILSNLENSKQISSLDEITHPFSDIMGSILLNFPYKFEDDSEILRKNLYSLGYFIGKWIYLIDALDDLKEDMDNNNFNPYNVLYNSNSLDFNKLILSCINEIDFYISNCLVNCSELLKNIPFKKHYSIIDNVINLGMINKYYEVLNKIPKSENNKINTSS